MKSNNQSILVLTGLPFRAHGNQSMFRFVKMLINKRYKICLVSSGKDYRGEKILNNDSFIYKNFFSINFFIMGLLKKNKVNINWRKIKSSDSITMITNLI